MPIMKTKKECFKYGESGKEYCGLNAREKARKQGIAIKLSQLKQKK